MAKAKSLTVNVRIEGGRQTLAAFRRLPKDASKELREGTYALSLVLARRVEMAARSAGPHAALMAGTVKARKDRVPFIQAGGTKRVGSQSRRSKGQAPTQAWQLLFGSEFGSNVYTQFKPHLGRGSYWFFKAVEDSNDEIAQAWNRIADTVARRFAGGAA